MINRQSTDSPTILQSHVTFGDPHTATDNKERLSMQMAIVEALVCVDRCGTYTPVLAKSWHVAADDCTWIFQLRANILFHDGTVLQAEDVVASIDRACNPDLGGELGTGGLYHRYLHEMKVTTLDVQTVQMITASPMADLLDLLVEIPIVPRHTLDQMPQQIIGSGPYQLVAVEDGAVTMQAFARYWGKAPQFSQLQWYAEPSGEQRVERLLQGTAEIISKVPVAQRHLISSSPKHSLHHAQDSVCVAFLCNAQRGVCADRRVRQALNYALDRDAMRLRFAGNNAELLTGPLTHLHLGYDPAVAAYPYDPTRAKALLQEAGWSDGMTLVLDIPDRLPDEAPNLAAMMATAYAAVGVTTEIRVFSDRPAYAELVKNKQIDDACCFDSSPLSTFRTLREKFHSGIRGPWWQGYANPAVDALLDQAQQTMDRTTRQHIYQRAYRILHDDAPWIFLYSPTLAWGVSSHLVDVTVSYDAVLQLH